MNSLLQADIFFFITSVAVILLTLALLAIAYYIWLIIYDVRIIVARMRSASDKLERDFDALRAHVHEEGLKSKAIVDLVLGFVTQKLTGLLTKRPKSKKTSSEI
jgi:hypothetical protein